MNKRLLIPFLTTALVVAVTVVVTAIEARVFHNVPSFYVSICLIAVGSSLTTLWRAWKDDCAAQERQLSGQSPENEHQGSVHHYGDGLSFYTFSRLTSAPQYVKNVTIADSPNLIDVAAVHAVRAGRPGAFLMPRPNRHGDILTKMKEHGVDMKQMVVHGFVTSRGVFVDRVKGAQIAKEAGQLLPGHENVDYLTSEDLWED